MSGQTATQQAAAAASTAAAPTAAARTAAAPRPERPDGADAFARRAVEIFNDGCLALMLSIGAQTGLLDVMGALPPATSERIADAAALNERYVREWLGAMTTAGIVRHDAGTDEFLLPAEHAASLTAAAGPGNLAVFTPLVAMLGEVEQRIVECFRHGGGLGYADYPRFHTYMAASSAAIFDATLIDVVLPMAPGVPQRLQEGIDVLDLGCGTGHAVTLLASAYPASRFVGYDFSPRAIDAARDEAAALRLPNARFELVDVATLDEPAGYDLITAFDAIHDQAHPATVLAAAHRALRPDGTFLMVDINASSRLDDNVGMPWAGFIYAVSTMHCMSVSLGADGAGLGTAWGRQLAESMLRDAGFTDIQLAEPPADPLNLAYIARKR